MDKLNPDRPADVGLDLESSRRFEMERLPNSRNFDDSDELTNSDKQLEDRLVEATETPSALKPALGSSPSDGRHNP
jgi:hypothetical protein